MSDEEVHVVSTGCYSDYRVLCACPSKQDAEAVVAKLKGDTDGWHDEPRVEVLPLVTAEIQQVDTLRMDVNVWDDGTTTDERETIRHEWPFDTLDTLTPLSWRWVRAPVHQNKGGRLEVWGTSHKRVRKVFSDRRAEALAEHGFRSKKEAKGRG